MKVKTNRKAHPRVTRINLDRVIEVAFVVPVICKP
jgi:hypothetical protein